MRSAIACIWVAIAVVEAACASTQTQIATASAITTLDDPFRPYREYSTGKISGGSLIGPSAAIGEKQLAARIDKKTGMVAMFLEFEIGYLGSSRRAYEHATNIRAEALTISELNHRSSNCNRQTGICDRIELLHVTLPETDLRNAGADGYPIKLFARTGPDVEIAVPKDLIVALLAKVDADRGSRQATAGNVAATGASGQ